MGIFDEQISRKPDNYPWAKDFIRAMHAGFWTDEEFSFSSDIQDFKVVLNEEEREIVVRTLSAIAQIEVAVKTFWTKLGDNLPHPSLSDLGVVLGASEVIHSNAYLRLLEVLGIEDIFLENLQLDCIKGRVNYLKKYNHKFYKDSKKQYIYALILFTLFVENVSLFSQFYIMLWFGRYKNVLKDTTQQITYTKNEELLHSKVGIKLINTIKKEYPELFDKDLEDKILHEAQEAYKAECKIVDWMLSGYVGTRISSDIIKGFIQSRINNSLRDIGYNQLFVVKEEVERDFEWMNEEILANNSTDFFHQRPTDYQRNLFVDENDLI
jgi:ribonucleoside-diphosphate reductase beta chain